jgi:DNA-binding MarR family transcriptional regulator
MPTEMKLANECIDCITAFVQSRAAQSAGENCGDVSNIIALNAERPVSRLCDGNSNFPAATNLKFRPIQPSQQDITLELDKILAARKARLKYFDQDLFFDPTWAMLLDLYRSELAESRISVSSLCLGSGVPSTTALRYIQILEAREYVERAADEKDKRRIFVRLTDKARDAMAAYFETIMAEGFAAKSRR